ncbi:hypothetical protein [Burkholderia gladioli]
MANIANFIGTEWKSGVTLPVAWQEFSFGRMSDCGTVDITELTDTSTAFTVNVSIPILGKLSAQITIGLDADDPSTSGTYTVTIDGGPLQSGQFSEGPANHPDNFPGGNAIFLKDIVYKGRKLTLQIWPVDSKTLLFLDLDSSASPWLCFGHR